MLLKLLEADGRSEAVQSTQSHYSARKPPPSKAISLNAHPSGT
jgi:hypothetical protein